MAPVRTEKKLDIKGKVKCLLRVPILSGIGEGNIDKLAKITSEKIFYKKNIIFHEGDYGDALYIIQSGRVKIAKIAMDGREKTLCILKGNDFFGEMSIFDDMPRSATAEAIDSEVRLLSISKSDFQKLLTDNPFISIQIIKDLVRRIRTINEQVQDLAFKDVHGRVASTLYNLLRTEIDSAPPELREKIDTLRTTHQDLANMVGSSRETVTRALNKLKDQGVIKISHQKITVLDLPRLLDY